MTGIIVDTGQNKTLFIRVCFFCTSKTTLWMLHHGEGSHAQPAPGSGIMKNNHLISSSSYDPLLFPKTSHLITGPHSPQPPLARMIKGQACHLVSRPSLKGRQKRERERGRKTPWHTGLMKAMNHSVVFKEHISGIINSAQRPGPG